MTRCLTRLFIDLPFFTCRIRTQALRLAVVMGLSTNGNRIANLRRRWGGQDAVRSQLGRRRFSPSSYQLRPRLHCPINTGTVWGVCLPKKILIYCRTVAKDRYDKPLSIVRDALFPPTCNAKLAFPSPTKPRKDLRLKQAMSAATIVT